MEQKIYSLSLRELDLPRRLSGLILISLMLFFSDFLWTQVPTGPVRIKESIIIKPTISDSIKKNYGLISDQPVTENAQYESLFLECGGSVTLKALENVGTIILLPSMQVIADPTVINQIYPVGTFSDSTYLKFGIRNDEPPHIVLKNNYGAMGVDNWYEIGLLVYAENNNRYYQIANLNFNVGDSCTCLDLRPPNGPPREPQPIVVPADTHLVVDFWNMKGRDSLYFYTRNELLRDTLFLDSALLRRAPVIDLGSVRMGDTMNFFLKSMVKFTKGEIMYPKSVFYGDSWGLGFENWIDNHFGDYAAGLYMAPTRYKMQFDKEKVLPGDTVRFQIEVIGTPNQNIESALDVNILKGRHYAVIVDTMGFLYGTDLSGSNRNYQPFEQIKNKLALVISNSAPIGEKIIIQVASTWSSIYSGRAEIEVQNQPTILLGESKYYQAKEINNQLKVFEYSTPQVGNLTNVTFSVDTVNCAGAGRRLGVYYEKKKPDGGSLPTDQIRLIGRYWHQDSTYKVRLVASKDGKTDTIVIDIVKPIKLGYWNNFGIDIDSIRYNLDSLILYYAGKFGILPQIIKADIEKESKNFHPSYRWEPFFDAWHINKNGGAKGTSPYLNDNFRYKVSSTGNAGTPNPPQHKNLKDVPYWGFQETIWDLFYNTSKTVNPNVTFDIYPKSTWYLKPLDNYNRIFAKIKDELKEKGVNLYEREGIARDSANKYLRYEWQDGIMNTAMAQTRSSASYGLMQIMYTTAIGRGYTRDLTSNNPPYHLPENLNINDTLFTYSIPYLLKNIQAENTYQNDNENNWKLGIDSTYSLVFSRYNLGTNAPRNDLLNAEYGPLVRILSNKYLPKLR